MVQLQHLHSQKLVSLLQAQLHHDQPLQTQAEQDFLMPSLQGLCQTLTVFLQCRELHAPALLAGDWGSGKTSLLYALKHRLQDQGYSVMVFDTWIYQHEDNLFQALCAAFLEHMQRLLKQEHPGMQDDARFAKIAGRILRIAAAVGSRATQGILTHFLGRSLGSIFDAQGILQTADKLEESQPAPAFSYQNPAEELRGAFQDLLEIWPLDVPPVILIDDLDRCAPDHAIDLLDAIRTMLAALADRRVEHDGDDRAWLRIPQFLVALDRDMIVEAMSQKFAGIESFDGNRYLEKVFPYCFHLPTGIQDDAVRLLQQCLHVEPDVPLQLSDRSRCALEQVLAQPFFANPRLIKRTLNRYRLFLFAGFVQAQGAVDLENLPACLPDQNHQNTEKMLVAWIAACERWPLLRNLLQRRREEYWLEMEEAVNKHNPDQMPGPLATKLLGQQAALAWLKQEHLLTDADVRQKFRQVDQALHRLGL